MYRQYAPTLKSTIGNDLTGQFTNGVAYDWTDRGRPTYSGVFSATRSQMQQGYAISWFNLSEVRFSGSSGTCSLLHLKPRYIKGGNHSHSRGTIGNDLTGYLTVTAPYGGWATGGVFSADANWSSNSPGYSDHVGRKARFSGSSGFTGSVSYAGDHSHSMSLNNTGGNRAHNNMPPYMAVYIWLRVA